MQKQLDLIICQGLPGSGKSTWSRSWVEEFPKSRVRVNRDEIRHQLGPYWIPTREKLVTDIETNIILCGLRRGYNVVVDATNLRGIQRFTDLVKKHCGELVTENIFVEVKSKSFLDVSLEDCLLRDSLRTEEQRVGPEVITEMYKSLKK